MDLQKDPKLLNKNNDIEDTEDEINSEYVIPFDPKLIKVNIVPRSIGQIVEQLEDNLIVTPKYQRKPDLWDISKKSKFIESLILQLPIPLFYFDELPDGIWSIVDGLQRICTLDHFIFGENKISNENGKFKLTNLEFLKKDYEGKGWDELDRSIKRKIQSNPTTINLIGKETPALAKYIIFDRINKGTLLKAQEIRTALFQGYRMDFLNSLISKDTETGKLFKQVTNNSIQDIRQEDLDFAARFVAFYLIDFKNYSPSMDMFINNSLDENNLKNEKEYLEKITLDFTKALELSYFLFKDKSFRKNALGVESFKINKPLFEVITVQFSRLNELDINKIKNNKDLFIQKIENMDEKEKFLTSITSSTASTENVKNRHKIFQSFLKKFLHDT